jgi:hypothetical protein
VWAVTTALQARRGGARDARPTSVHTRVAAPRRRYALSNDSSWARPRPAIVPGNFSPYRSTRADDAVGRRAAANKVELGFVGATDTRELRWLLPPRLVVYFVLALWLFGGAPVVTRGWMGKLVDALYHRRRGGQLLDRRARPGRLGRRRRGPAVASAEYLLVVSCPVPAGC